MMKKTIFIHCSIAAIVLLFAYTASSKLLEYDKFVFQMQLVQLPFITKTAPILGWLIPAIELSIVVLILQKSWRLMGLYATLFLLFVFELYIGTLLFSGLNLPCTCGGIIAQMGWKTHLLFNACIMILALNAILYYRKTNKHIQGQE